MIKLKDVSKFYYNKGIISSGFNKVSCEFNLGEFVVVTGESGSGKSTLLNVISGLDTYEEGEMYINGKETSHYTDEDFENYRKKYISNIFQNFNLVNSYTVYQNIELVLLINGESKKNIKAKILEIIKEVDLLKYKNTKVSKLSGGQKQRVAIARALAKNTPIIIADEPTGNLDSRSATSVMKTLAEVAKEKLVIIVTHNYEQMEEYATRKITMHDGKIIEDKQIKKTSICENKSDNEFKQITLISKIRLGMRNAFNIKTKFILLLVVYLFMGSALIAEHASFQKGKYNESTSGYNSSFQDLSPERIIIKKSDKTAFTDADYEIISKLSNVKYIVKNDLELDSSFSLTNEGEYYFYGSAKNIARLTGKLDYGKMPTNAYEIVISGDKNDYYLKQHDNLLNKEVYFTDNNTGLIDKSKAYTIVGIKYDNNNHYNTSFLGNDDFLKMVALKNLEMKNKVTFTLNNKSLTNSFKINDNVPAGYAYVPSSLNAVCPYYNCRNKTLSVKLTNLYYEHNIDLKISKTFDKTNFKSLTNLKDYDYYANTVFINSADFNLLNETNNYQSSVFVKDAKLAHSTEKLLEENNLDALVVTDALANYSNGFVYILNIFNVIVTAILIIVMFFISYFIIKIILKSRNTYYSTLRILGSNKKTARKLLEIELYTIANLAFLIVMIFIVLINKDYLLSGVKDLLSFMKIKDYLFIYISIMIMTYLISIRFSASLFKSSAMKTYNEEA